MGVCVFPLSQAEGIIGSVKSERLDDGMHVCRVVYVCYRVYVVTEAMLRGGGVGRIQLEFRITVLVSLCSSVYHKP